MAFNFIDQVFSNLLQAYTVGELETLESGSLSEFQQVLKMLEYTYNQNFERKVNSVNQSDDLIKTEISMNLGELIKKMNKKENNHFLSADEKTETLLESVRDSYSLLILYPKNKNFQLFLL